MNIFFNFTIVCVFLFLCFLFCLLQCRRVQSAETLNQKKKIGSKNNINKTGLTAEQQRLVSSAKAQFERRGGFVRIFPSPKSWELYSQYLGKLLKKFLSYFISKKSSLIKSITFSDPLTGIPNVNESQGPVRVSHSTVTNHNLMLHEQLFPAASRSTDYIIPEVKLDRLTRYFWFYRSLIDFQWERNVQTYNCRL